jgi:hypothetical protein
MTEAEWICAGMAGVAAGAVVAHLHAAGWLLAGAAALVTFGAWKAAGG